MKIVKILFFSFFSFPILLAAQTVEEQLQRVSATLAARQEVQAVSLFERAVELHPDKSEMYYWIEVDKNSTHAAKLAQKLALYYHKHRNWDKAYLFYKELLQQDPNNVAYLAGYAEAEVCCGREDDALRTYEKILIIDANNLDANIFLGNYLFLKAEGEKKRLDTEYKRLASPSRMEYARYKDALSNVLSERYEKAREYLQQVIQRFHSTEAQKILTKIRLAEIEIKR